MTSSLAAGRSRQATPKATRSGLSQEFAFRATSEAALQKPGVLGKEAGEGKVAHAEASQSAQPNGVASHSLADSPQSSPSCGQQVVSSSLDPKTLKSSAQDASSKKGLSPKSQTPLQTAEA